MQDLHEVGSVLGSTRMSFETVDSKSATGLMKIMNSDLPRKVQVAEELQNPPVPTGRQSAFMIYAFFKINDGQVRAMSMTALHNIELANDNLKKLDRSWEETLMLLKKEPKGDSLEGLYHRQLEMSTLMQTAVAL